MIIVSCKSIFLNFQHYPIRLYKLIDIRWIGKCQVQTDSFIQTVLRLKYQQIELVLYLYG